MRRGSLIAGLLIGIVFGSRFSEAQYTADFQTNIISGVTNNWTGDYLVGSTNFGDALLIQNSGLLSDGNGYVGYQVSASNNNVQVNGTHSVWSSSYTLCLGYSGSGNRLVISNGGKVVNGSDGTLGYQSSSSNNNVVVTDAGSVWSNVTSLHVGSFGSGNTLVVSNGGKLFNLTFYLGDSSNSINNRILISGPGSVWNGANSVYIGYSGAGNSCVLSNGGAANNTNGYVGYNSGSSNNNVMVAGLGSVWSNYDALYVGYSGAGNTLGISNAGNVFSGDIYVGNSSSGSNNSVLVTGSGSVWGSGGRLYVGNNGSRNSLVVDGGTVLASNMVVGYNLSASNNSVKVDSGNLIVTNALGKGSLVFGRAGQGKLILNNGTVIADTLIFNNGANSMIEFNGGQLNSRSTTVSNAMVFAVGNGTNSAALYLGGGSHSFADGLWIRTNAMLSGCGTINGAVLLEGDLRADCGGLCIFTGSVTNNGRIEVMNDTLLLFYGPVVNQGQIIATNGVVRYYSAFGNNGTLLGDIQDGGNVWINSTNGRWEDGMNWTGGAPTNWHWCVITNSSSKTVTIDAVTASAYPETLCINGLNLASTIGETNTLLLSNSGTVTPLEVQRGLAVGLRAKLMINQGAVEVGAFNEKSLTVDGQVSMAAATLIVTNGPTWIGDGGNGQVATSKSTALTREVLVGHSTNMTGVLTVFGSNSVWNCSSNVYIGWYSGGNELEITDGGQMVNGDGYIGYAFSSSNNDVAVTGSNSIWSNGRFFRIGYSGEGNSLVISNGGCVLVNRDAWMGYNASSSNNCVLVTGAGSIWNTATNLYVGYSGWSNSLVISNGGKMISSVGYVGYGIGNNALVTGSTSVWSNRNDLYVGGSFGGNNSLAIKNGGHVVSKNGYVGTSFSVNNSVLVTDPGSVWNSALSGTLNVGNSGIGNSTLVISNSGQVVSGVAYIGYGSSDNNAIVTGTGSVWSNIGYLVVGFGRGNSLVISDGGQVFSSLSEVGSGGGNPTNNHVLVTGSGSIWNSGWLYVGEQTAGNSLVISNGGMVSGPTGYIGYFGEAPSNTVRVVDGGIWETGQLDIGEFASSNSLVIVGGSVFAVDLVIGAASSTCDNLVELDGGNLVVATNGTGTGVLEVRRGKFILNGGTLQVDRFVMTNACAQFVRTGGTLIYGTAVLDQNRDDDGDGIPNGWEQTHGLDPLNAADANVDSDGDGLSNLQEYLAGTDPTNSVSSFRITSLVETGQDILVAWTSGTDKTNALQVSAGSGDYDTNSFISIFTVTNTTGAVTNYLDIGAATNVPGRFYRVRWVP